MSQSHGWASEQSTKDQLADLRMEYAALAAKDDANVIATTALSAAGIATFALAFHPIRLCGGIVGPACPARSGFHMRPELYACLSLLPLMLLAVLVFFAAFATVRGKHLRVIERAIWARSGTVISAASRAGADADASLPIPAWGHLGLIVGGTTRQSLPLLRPLWNAVCVVVAGAFLVSSAQVLAQLPGGWLQVTWCLVTAAIVIAEAYAFYAATAGFGRQWTRLLPVVFSRTPRSRSLPRRYFWFPRPVDLPKGLYVLVAYVTAWLATGQARSGWLAPVLVTVALELLPYGARYIVNDLRGIDEAESSPDQQRVRPSLHTPPAELRLLMYGALLRLVVWVAFVAVIWQWQSWLGWCLFYATVALAPATLIYEGSRWWAQRRAREHPASVFALDAPKCAIYVALTFGYVIRGGLGATAAGAPVWLVVLIVAVCVLFAETTTLMAWVLEGSQFLSANGTHYDKQIAHKSHFGPLLRQAGLVAPGAQAVDGAPEAQAARGFDALAPAHRPDRGSWRTLRSGRAVWDWLLFALIVITAVATVPIGEGAALPFPHMAFAASVGLLAAVLVDLQVRRILPIVIASALALGAYPTSRWQHWIGWSEFLLICCGCLVVQSATYDEMRGGLKALKKLAGAAGKLLLQSIVGTAATERVLAAPEGSRASLNGSAMPDV